MRILIGSTGFIGKNLQSFLSFDKQYSSTNINYFESVKQDTDLYLTCLPATKWLINKNPISDLKNAIDIFNIIKNEKYNNVYLFSTIDVYKDSAPLSNENTLIKFSNFGYGQNRYFFETMIRDNLNYKKLKIIRLPALFGPGLKKNILFDIKNNNELQNININSIYQWYNINRLKDDLSKINLIDDTIFNVFPEPVHTLEFIDKGYGYFGNSIEYNFTTNHTKSGYWYDKYQSIKEIKEFLCN